jgi:hypothetical protein
MTIYKSFHALIPGWWHNKTKKKTVYTTYKKSKHMKNTTLILSAFIMLTLATASCKKSSTPGKSAAELLTQKVWLYQTSGIDADRNGTIDTADDTDDCEKDNSFTFNTNGTGVMDEGATKCDSGDPQTENFNWVLTNNTQLTLTGGTNTTMSGTVQTLSETALTVYQDVSFGGASFRVIIQFKH